MSDWLQVSAILPPESADAAECALIDAGALSVTFMDAGDSPVLEPAAGTTPLWPRLVVTGLFAPSADALRVLARLAGTLPAAQWRLAPLADREWEREWLKDFRPIRFGTRLWVAPAALDAPEGSVVVRLEPGLAFGTGTHPTTALCLEWLEGLRLDGAMVLDYGCGSGILAIAAARLGAARVVAVDNDPQALQATRQNAASNDVAQVVTACAPAQLDTVLRGARADVLVANILAGPLAELAPRFAQLLRGGGRVALSGILRGQESSVGAACASWFALDAPVAREDWVRLQGIRKECPAT